MTDTAGIPRAVQVMALLVNSAQAVPGFEDVDPRDCLAPGADRAGDLIEWIARDLVGCGLHHHVEVVSPDYCFVCVVPNVSEPRVQPAGEPFEAYTATLRWVDELNDWRVLTIGRRPPVELLPA